MISRLAISNLTPNEKNLILTNVLIPLLGTLLFNWSLSSILFFYWFENVVVGIFNVVKIYKATGTFSTAKFNGKPYSPERNSKGSIAGFFILHYGLFTFIHGTFIAVIFGQPEMSTLSFLLSFALLVFTHWRTYKTEFVDTLEYTKVSPADLFIYPYPRIFILHLVIIFGAIPVLLLGAPLITLCLLVFLKTYVDLRIGRFKIAKLSSFVKQPETKPTPEAAPHQEDSLSPDRTSHSGQ